MPIRNSDGEIIGVAQAINKSPSGALFTEDDEKVTYFPLLIFWLLVTCIFKKTIYSATLMEILVYIIYV